MVERVVELHNDIVSASDVHAALADVLFLAGRDRLFGELDRAFVEHQQNLFTAGRLDAVGLVLLMRTLHGCLPSTNLIGVLSHYWSPRSEEHTSELQSHSDL